MYVVTGLTRMSAGRICLSVFDTESNRYLRPIPPQSKYTDEDVQNLQLFSVVNLTFDHRPHLTLPPHTEDYPVINREVETTRVLNRTEQLTLLNQIADTSTYDVFGFSDQQPHLQQRGIRNYVIPNTGDFSLGTIRVEEVRIYINYNKLRVDFTDIEGNNFRDVAYVSAHQNEPIQINNMIATSRNKYVRLSLSRELLATNWDFKACFLQVSSIHGYY